MVESEEGWLIPLDSSWQRGDVAEDDCVVILFPLSNRVRMNGDGRAVTEPHPEGTLFFCPGIRST